MTSTTNPTVACDSFDVGSSSYFLDEMSFRISLAGKSQLGSKARAEEDKKARKEEEDRKRVLADFLEEHGDDDDALPPQASRLASDADPDGAVPQGTKRHFTNRMRSLKSGPGTLDNEPLDNFGRPPPRFGAQHPPQFGGLQTPTRPAPTNNNNQEENVYTTLVAKVSNLPTDTTKRTVARLFEDYYSLKIVKIETIAPSAPGDVFIWKGRPYLAMKVTFHKDASPREFDEAMNKMNDRKYLGRGYYLHLDRYFGDNATKMPEVLPFAGRWVYPEKSKEYAPTAELGGAEGRKQARDEQPKFVVTAYPPQDLDTVMRVHRTIEAILSGGGMAFEASLMAKPEIQADEKFAFLYDSCHPVGRYYRWKLYSMATGNYTPKKEIYEGEGEWWGPSPGWFPGEFTGPLHPKYEEPDVEEWDRLCKEEKIDWYPGIDESGYGWMTPKSRMYLLWLLGRFPLTHPTNYEMGPIACFAADNATRGLDEIVKILISNIFRPIRLSPASSQYRPIAEEGSDDVLKRKCLKQATLNALLIIHDVTRVTQKESGKCWKYRELIGSELVRRQVFDYLEQLPGLEGWGRIETNHFKEEVNKILSFWQEESVFSDDILREFDEAFNWRQMMKEWDDEEREERRLAEKKAKGSQPVKGIKVTAEDEAMEIDTNDDNTAEIESANHQSQEQQPTPATVESLVEVPGETAAARARRMRPKAEDMFASDEE